MPEDAKEFDYLIAGAGSAGCALAARLAEDRSISVGLVEAGGAILIPEKLLNAASLAEQVTTVLTHPKAAVQMAHAALATGKPDATEQLVALVEHLAQRAGT